MHAVAWLVVDHDILKSFSGAESLQMVNEIWPLYCFIKRPGREGLPLEMQVVNACLSQQNRSDSLNELWNEILC